MVVQTKHSRVVNLGFARIDCVAPGLPFRLSLAMDTTDEIPDFFTWDALRYVVGTSSRSRFGRSAVCSGAVRNVRWDAGDVTFRARATVESYVSTGKWYLAVLEVSDGSLSLCKCPCKEG